MADDKSKMTIRDIRAGKFDKGGINPPPTVPRPAPPKGEGLRETPKK